MDDNNQDDDNDFGGDWPLPTRVLAAVAIALVLLLLMAVDPPEMWLSL